MGSCEAVTRDWKRRGDLPPHRCVQRITWYTVLEDRPCPYRASGQKNTPGHSHTIVCKHN